MTEQDIENGFVSFGVDWGEEGGQSATCNNIPEALCTSLLAYYPEYADIIEVELFKALAGILRTVEELRVVGSPAAARA